MAVSALLALAELLLSGVRMPSSILGLSLGLFAVSALIEGAITMAVMGALEAIQPNFARPAARLRGAGDSRWTAVALAAVILAAGGVVFASTAPDGIQRLAIQTGIAQHAHTLFAEPVQGLSGRLPGRRMAGAGGCRACLVLRLPAASAS